MRIFTQMTSVFRGNYFNGFAALLFLMLSSTAFGQTNPTAFNLSTGSWTLTGWNSGVAAGSYPGNGATGSDTTTGVVATAGNGNMMFWKHGTGDPLIATAASGNYTGTYVNASGTIYGNGTSGIGFNNTGGAGIGSAVLAINTTGRTNVQVAWTARTIATGARTYGIRLMYRVGTSGSFVDANGTASNIFYPAAASAGSTTMPTITLPAAVNNAGTVQLMWFYYNEATTTSGTRPTLGLDDITVSSSGSGPTVNGTIAASEYGTHTDGSNQDTNTITWYNTWDNTNLYFGIGATSNNSTEAAVIYIDVNPIVPVNGGSNTNGTNTAFTYDRGTANPAFRADYVLYFKSGYYELRAANGSGGWGSAVTTGLTYAQSGAGATNAQEISIPWSALGGSLPSSYNWSAYKMYDVSASNNGIYGQVPANNPGGAQNVAAYTVNLNRYYTVSSTTSGSSTLPFSRTSYCQPISVTTNNFGVISVYDLTVNPGSGFQLARSNAGGDWTVGGSLVVGSGTLYFGSGGSGYGNSTIANVNVTGGTLNMDQTNKVMTVSGNVTVASGAALTLSGTSGGDLSIAGNWSNAGTFTCNSRQVIFGGSTAQTLTGSTTFDYLKLNNAAGVTLQASSPVTVNTNLDLTSGKLTLGANNLTLLAAASVTNASATGYVVTNGTGAFVRNSVGNSATSFPVGLAASYTPLSVTNTGTSNNLSLIVTSPPTNAVSDATKIVNLEWNLNSGGAGAVSTIDFNWNTGNQGASYSATGQGELGNYSAGPNYAVTNIGTMAGQTKTVTGVALSSGNNRLVIGNTGAVYTAPPANDDCATPTSLTVNATATSGNNAAATKSNPSTLSGVSAYTTGTAKDMWYTFTATCSGAHTITMTPTGFDGAVALFTGGTCPNPTYTSSADAGASGVAETINFTATAGTTYRILAWGYNSSSGSFTIGVTSSVTQNFTLANTGTPATGNVAANTNNAVLYGFSLTPAACTGSFDFTAASITTSGTATTSDLSNFRLIVDANANGAADAGEISSPIGTISTLANPLNFTVTGQTGLTAITRYLLIADVAPGATGGNNFTASMTAANITATAPMTVSGTANGNAQTITAAAIAIADNTQVTAGNIIRGTTSNIISKAQLTVSGQNTTVTAMNFVTAGVSGGYVSADITSGGFKLWVNTTNSFGSATQVGSGVSSAKATATNTETLSFTTSQNLTVGTTYYYWLTVDVAATATVNRTITVNGLTNASVVSAGTSITGSTTAAGAQTILAPTLVIANNTVVPAGNVLINSTGNIVARAQFTVTNATVSLSAMSYVTASNASGYTSADIATGGFKLWVSTTNSFGTATQVGTGQSSTKVTAASTETITFTSTQNLTAGVYYYWLTADIASAATAGKLIIVNGLSSASLTSTTTGVALSGTTSASGTQTIVAPTLTISNNTQITTQNLFAGSTNNIVSKAQVVPTNDNVSASAISFVTAGNAAGYTSGDIATGGFKLWVNTTNTFGTATQVGTGQSSTKTIATNTETITFTATQNFTLGNTYYYWLTADIAAAPTVGDILVVNGLSGTSITTTTANAVVTGTTSATGNQTIVVPTVTLANTGAPATGSIAVGANNVLLFGFALTPNTSVDFTAASITTSGTATTSDLSNFRLIYDANANGVADTAEITGAIGNVSTLSGTLSFTGITGQTGFSTVRRYLLIADAASGATSGRTFTGNLTAANITTTATANTGSAVGNAQTLIYIPLAGEILINQINYGYSAASDEYVELVNTTNKTFDLSLLKISYQSSAGGAGGAGGTLSGILQPHSFWLLSPNATITFGQTSGLARDGSITTGFSGTTGGQIGLLLVSDDTKIDGVGYGTVTGGTLYETGSAGTLSTNGYRRNIDGVDTNNNTNDFVVAAAGSVYLRNSTGRLANAGTSLAAGSYRDVSVTGASSLGGNVSVTSQIRLDNSGILATSGNVLTLTSTGAVSRISGWVNGSFKKNVATGATSRTFEIGGATFYRPVTVAFGSVTTAGDLTATLSPSAGDYPAIAASGIDAAKSVNRYWTLTNSGIAFTNYGATFTFDASDVDGGANTANFIVRNYDGAWATSTAGSRTATTTQATGITTFGDFVIGETTGSPTIGTHPSNVSSCASAAASFNSASSSVPTPAISWERGISGTYTPITGGLDGGVYSGFNTATLSISNTSGLNGYTYRAVYTNINGTVTTTAATLTTGATKTYASSWSPSAPTSLDAAVITSNYSEVADITACSLTVTSGAVVIPSGNNVTLSGALVVSGGSFTLENNANLIQTGTTNNNSGNITVKRNSSALKRLDYTLWSSPVTGQELYAFSPLTFANRFYVYRTNTNFYNNGDVGLNVTNTNTDGVNGTDQNHVQFATAKGYLIRVPWNHPTAPAIWTGTFTGVPNNGDINYTMADNGSGFRFNLVGNPYPSPISMSQFVTDNSANITGTLYFWRETNNNTSNNAYCSWAGGTFVSNNEAQVVNPNGIIRTGQGFFVEGSGNGTTLSFKNGQRSSDNANQFFRTNNTVNTVDNNRFWLNLTSTAGEFAQMAAGYMEGATDGVDFYDGKNINTGNVLLNSILDNTDYTIQGKALPFNSADVIPLSYKVTNAGDYSIAIDHTDGLFAGSSQPIYLKDNLMNTEFDLQTGAYTFTSVAGSFTNRFEIVFQSQLGVENPVFNANTVVIYPHNNEFVINSGSIIMASVKVFDIRGRLIESKKDINASNTTIKGGLSNQVLLVQITSEDGAVVTKKIVR